MRKLLAVAAMGIAFLVAAQNVNAQCDRQCLESFVNQYLAAMVAHDASSAVCRKCKISRTPKFLPSNRRGFGIP
jgi:hypothetical protein